MDDAAVEDETGFALPVGTLDEARAMIGKRTPSRVATAPASWGRIQQFCAMTRDGNPSYWDAEFARATWGDIASPPAMLETWLMPLEWSPTSSAPEPRIMARVPLPGRSMINGANDTTFHQPVLVGDLLSVEEEVVSVSDLKSTRLGDGHFVETLSVFHNQRG